MKNQQIEIAKDCLNAAENDTLNFPQIVGNLIAAGFESYTIDFRLGKAFYFLPSGEAVTLDTYKVSAEIGKDFDVEAIKAAIKEAQQQVENYTYKGFCKKLCKRDVLDISFHLSENAQFISDEQAKHTLSIFHNSL